MKTQIKEKKKKWSRRVNLFWVLYNNNTNTILTPVIYCIVYTYYMNTLKSKFSYASTLHIIYCKSSYIFFQRISIILKKKKKIFFNKKHKAECLLVAILRDVYI